MEQSTKEDGNDLSFMAAERDKAEEMTKVFLAKLDEHQVSPIIASLALANSSLCIAKAGGVPMEDPEYGKFIAVVRAMSADMDPFKTYMLLSIAQYAVMCDALYGYKKLVASGVVPSTQPIEEDENLDEHSKPDPNPS